MNAPRFVADPATLEHAEHSHVPDAERNGCAHRGYTGLACGGNPWAAWDGVAFPGNEVNADDGCAVGPESR